MRTPARPTRSPAARHQIALYGSLAYVYRQGWAAGISPDVQALAGHAPRPFTDFATEYAAAWQ